MVAKKRSLSLEEMVEAVQPCISLHSAEVCLVQEAPLMVNLRTTVFLARAVVRMLSLRPNSPI